MRRLALALGVCAVSSCEREGDRHDHEPPGSNSWVPPPTDADNDGYTRWEDCDDGEYWDSPEDRDGDGLSGCDGDCDDNDAAANRQDVDGDGVSTCALDCDDTDVTLRAPGDRICGDGVDGDCDLLGDCEWFGDVELPTGPGSIEAVFAGSIAWNSHVVDVDSDDTPDLIVLVSDSTRTFRGPVDSSTPVEDAYSEFLVQPNQGIQSGDLTGDGLVDLVLTDSSQFSPTVAYVFSNPGSGTHEIADAFATVAVDPAQGGTSLAFDFTGDGVAELVLGEPLDAAIHAFDGPFMGVSTLADVDLRIEITTGSFLDGLAGGVLASVDDLDGTAAPYLLTHAPNLDTSLPGEGLGEESEGAILLTPWVTGVLNALDLVATVDTDSFAFASKVTVLGDTDGDGYSDLAASASGIGGAGAGALGDAFRILRGSTGGLPPDASMTTDRVEVQDLGRIIELFGPGDVNQDGFADLMFTDTAPNRVVLAYGPFVGAIDDEARSARFSTVAGGYVGQSLGVVDWNEDGAVELLISATAEAAGDPALFVVPGILTGL